MKNHANLLRILLLAFAEFKKYFVMDQPALLPGEGGRILGREPKFYKLRRKRMKNKEYFERKGMGCFEVLERDQNFYIKLRGGMKNHHIYGNFFYSPHK